MAARSHTPHITIAALAAIALGSASPPALADEVVTAQALFDQGKRAMAAHDYATACPKLEASLKLQEALGTMLNLAVCYEQQGKLASAWSRFLEVSTKARAAGQAERARIGREHAAALAPKLSNVLVDVPPENRVPGLEVRRDRTVMESAEWGAAIPVDAGEHTIEASAPGHKPWSQTVNIADDATTVRVVMSELPPLAAESPRTTAGGPGASPTPTAPVDSPAGGASSDRSSRSGGAMKVFALAVGGVGLAGIGVGAAFGALAMSKRNEAIQACPSSVGHTCPTAARSNAWNDAYGFGNVSTAAVAIGGAALAAGVVLWLLAPSRAETASLAAQLTVGPGVVAVRCLW